MVCNGKPLLKWMIWGYPYFWKHPSQFLPFPFPKPLPTSWGFCNCTISKPCKISPSKKCAGLRPQKKGGFNTWVPWVHINNMFICRYIYMIIYVCMYEYIPGWCLIRIQYIPHNLKIDGNVGVNTSWIHQLSFKHHMRCIERPNVHLTWY